MASSTHREEAPTVDQNCADEMGKYGITRIPVDYFHYKEFRYTNLVDAIAQARRQLPHGFT